MARSTSSTSKTSHRKKSKIFTVGQIVSAMWCNDDNFHGLVYPGSKVEHDNGDGTYHIVYPDGDEDPSLDAEYIWPTASTLTTTSLTSTTSDESGFWCRGVSYPTYQEMVAAKRGGNKDKLESLGLGEEAMASMRREAAAEKKSKAKKKNKSKKKSKEEIGVPSREYPLRNRVTTPVRLSQEAVAELVQKSEEIQNQKGTEEEVVEKKKKKKQPKKKQRPKKKTGGTTVNGKGQAVSSYWSSLSKQSLSRHGAYGVHIDNQVRADNDAQLGQVMRTLVLNKSLWHIKEWSGRIKNELKVTDRYRGTQRMVLSISEDPQEESKPISGLRFHHLSDVVDRCKLFKVGFNDSRSDHNALHGKMLSAGFKRVKGPTEGESRNASKDVIDSFEYIYVHPLFQVNKPELVRKIVATRYSKWSYDSL